MAGLLPALRRAARRPCRGIRALPAAALLALPLLFGPAPAAEAQTTRLLVGNQGAGTSSPLAVVSNYYPAQAFTTGANSAGYNVANVEIEFTSAPSAAALGDMTLTIRNADGSDPGTVVGTLTNPGSGGAGFNTFTAPGGGIDLAASTTYFVDIRGLSGGNTLSLTAAAGTGNGNEQSGSLSDWSIADAFRLFSAGSWADRTGATLRMKISGTVKMAPAAPTGLMARAGDARVTLTWDDPDNDSITGYEYQQRTSGGSWGGWTDFTSDADTTTLTVTGLTNGTAYEFQLRAVNASGASAASETVSATPAVPAAPAAPTGFTIDTGDTEITLKWTDPGNDAITKYQYRQGTGPSGSITWADWTDIPASDEDTTEHKVTGLTNGTRYYFEVRAVAGTVNGTATASTAITPVAKPAAPTGLSATGGATEVTLSWTNPSNATITGYEYRQRTSGSSTWGEWTAIASSGATTTSHTVTGLTNYTGYDFQLRAVGLSGNGARSTTESAIPRPAGAPDAPGLTITDGDTQVTLAWSDPSNNAITKYQYRRGTGPSNSINWGNWTDIPMSGAATTGYTVTGLTNGTRYWFEVRAVAGTVFGVASSTFGDPNPKPAQPTGLSAAPGDGQVVLTWSDPSDSSIFSYGYELRTGNTWGGLTLFTSDDTTTTYTVTGLTNGTEYGFRLYASNTIGISPASAVVTATPLDASALDAPTGLTATAGDASGEVDLSWTAPSGTITKYQVRRGSGDPLVWGAWTDIPNSASLTSHTVTGLTDGTQYSFQIRAVSGTGGSTVLGAMSGAMTATPMAPTPEVSVAIVRGESLTVDSGGALLLTEDVAVGTIPVQFRVSASPAPATDLTVCVSIAETGVDRVAASAEGAKTVTITGGSATADYPAISWADDAVDNRDSLVTMTVVAPSDSSCSQTGYTVSSSASSGSFRIRDNERTTLALSSTDTTMTEGAASQTAVAAVTLGRRLYAGETLAYRVGLSTTTGARLPDGDGATPQDFTVSVSGTGVAATGLDTASPVVTFTGDDDNTVQVATLTFTPTAGTDADGADEAVRVGFGSPGSATNVGGGAAGTGSVDLTIDDSAGLVLSATTLTVAEGGSGTYTVALASQPTAEVTVTVGGVSGEVTVDTDGDTGGNQNTLTFTTGDWNTAQTVTVSADEDGDTDNDSATLTHTAAGGDYAGVTGDSVEVTVTDDDTPGVATATTDGEATEGSATDTATFTVVLNTVPSSDVTVTVTAPAGLTLDGPDAGSTFGSSEALTFTNSNWGTPQTVTVRATDDSTDSPIGRELTVTWASTSSDTDYSGLSGDAATVTVVDNDATAVTLAGSAGDVVEGGTKDFTITLNRGLVNGETLPVPLTFSGGATRGTDYTTACPTTPPTGVACANLDSGNAMVTFTGASGSTTATTVTLTLSATTDSTTETGGETVIIGLGTLNANSGTGLGGGASGTDTLADFSITDPDTSVPTVEITGVPDRISGTGDLTATFTFSEDVTGFVTDDVTVTGGTKGAFTATSATVYTLAVTPAGGANVVVTVAEDSATDGTNTGPASAETATAVWTALVFSSAAVTVVEEASATYTVALSSQPDASVTVTVGGASGEVTFDTDSATPGTQTTALTFTTTNWSTARTVTVLAAADNDTENDSATLTHSASGGGYGSVTGSVAVTVTDNDTPGLVLDPTSLTVAEGGSGTYTVALATQPTGTVTVTVGGASGDVTVDTDSNANGNQNTLTFSTTTWSTAQTVTVSAGGDNDTANDTATLTHSASGGGYGSVTGSVAVTVTDDDTVGVTTAQPSDRQVTEGSTTDTATFTVVLNTPPSDPVSVTVTAPAGLTLDGPDAGATFASSEAIPFDNTNWNSARTVTVRATNDNTDSPIGRELTVTWASTSSDSDYSGLSGDAATVTVVDNDPTAVTLAGAAGDVVEGGTKTFTITLNRGLVNGEALPVPLTFGGGATRGTDYTTACPTTPPTGVTCANLDSGNAMVTFTGASGSTTATTVTLTLSATTDSTTETGGETVIIGLGTLNANSGTGLGGGASGTDTLADFSITDPDTSVPTVEITGVPDRISGTGDLTATFTFSEDVTGFVTDDVTVTGGTKGAFTATSATVYTLAVTPAGGANVVVTVAEDSATDGTNTGPASAETATAVWTALVFSSAAVTVVEEASATYTVALSSQPDASVTVTVGGASGEVTFDTDSATPGTQTTALTFTTTNWSTARTVTVLAAADNDTENDSATLTHSASGGGYGSVTGSVAVTVTDNDTPGLVLDPTSLTVAEGGSGTYTVALATQPTGTVTVTVGGASGDVTVDTDSNANGNQNTLTFSTTTWSTAQTVTVSAGGDNDTANDTATLTHSASGGGYGSVTGSVAVTVTDDDTVGVTTAQPSDRQVTEGSTTDTATFTVVLNTPPSDPVSVTVTAPAGLTLDGPDAGATFASSEAIPFDNTNWNSARTVTVRATNDNTDSPIGRELTVTWASTSSDSDYSGLSGDAATVTVVDNDPTAVTLAGAAGDVVEGGTKTFTITLNRGLVNGEALPVPLTFGGGATRGTDYTTACPTTPPTGVTCANLDSGNAMVTFTGASGSTTATTVTLTLSATTDSTTETGGETVIIGLGTLNANSGTGLGGGASGTDTLADFSITDPDTSVPTVEITGVPDRISGTGDLTATFTFSEDVTGFVTDDVTVTGGTKGAFTATSATVYTLAVTPAGGANVVVTVAEDSATDGTNTGPASAETATAVWTALVFSSATVTVVEEASATYTVALSSQPDGNVTVTVGGASGEVTVDTDSTANGNQNTLTFSTTTWNTPRTVTVSAGQDNDTTNDSATLTHSASGGGYGSVTGSVAVTVTDNDTPGLVLDPTSLTVAEGGSGTYTVALATQPTGTVTVTVGGASGDVTVDTDSNANGNQNTLTFSTTTWSTAQTVTVSADEDDDTTNDSATLTHSASGGGYGSVTGSVAVTVNDDDGATPQPPPQQPPPPSGGGGGGGTPSLPRSAASVSAGPAVVEGGEATFRITASPAPSDEITVRVRVSATGDFVEAALLGERSVTLSASAPTASLRIATIDDRRNEADGTVTVTLLSGEDYRLSQASASLAVTDDDTPALVLTPKTLTVDEGGSATWTVALATEPAADVTVTVASTNGEVTTARNTLTFTASNWNVAQSVVVSAAQDADAADDRARLDHRASGGGYGSVTGSVAVTVMDDDTPGLVLTPAALTVAEGASATYAVTLATEPTGNVTVTVTGTSEVTVDRSTLSFTAGNWSVAQSVTLFAAPDDDMVNDLATLAHRARGGDYSSVTGSVAVTVTDAGAAVVSAHLARFGRTVAEQALEGIADRLTAPRTPGMEGAFAGRALSFALAGDGQAAPGPTGSAQGSSDADGLGFTPRGFGDDADHFGESYEAPQTTTMRQALLGSNFTLTGVPDDAGGSAAFWGRAAEGRFEGREDTLSLEGTVTTALLGADYARGDWLLGLALTQSASEGSYAGGARAGDLDASLSAALPYASLHATPRLKLWGAAGLGAGEVTLKTQEARYRADTEWTMAAAGLRSTLLTPPPEGAGPALVLTADALWTRTASERARALAASASDVTRLRLGLEGRYRFALADDSQLTPRLEAGVRHDGGDAETGLGVELGGGLAWSAPTLGLTLDVSGRTLIAHDDDDLKDRGLAAALTFDPRPESARGPSLSLRQDVGDRAEGGLDALFAPDPLAERTESTATARWTLEGAWGLPALGGRFTASPHAALGLSHDTRETTLGWRLTPQAPAAPDLTFGVKATRREEDTEPPAHTVGVEATVRW